MKITKIVESLPKPAVKISLSVAAPLIPKTTIPSKLGQTNPENVQPYKSAKKMPNTFIPTGVIGAGAGR